MGLVTPDSVKFIADSHGVRTEAEWMVSRQLRPVVKALLFVVFALSPLVLAVLVYKQTEHHNKEVIKQNEDRNKEERRRNDLAQVQAEREERRLELWAATLDTAKQALVAPAAKRSESISQPTAKPDAEPQHSASVGKPDDMTTAMRVHDATARPAVALEAGATGGVVASPESGSALPSEPRSAVTLASECEPASAATATAPAASQSEPTPESVRQAQVNAAVERAQWQLEANELAILRGIKRDADRRGSSTYHVAELPLSSATKLRSTPNYSIYELRGVTVTLRHRAKSDGNPLVTSIEIGL